jgi:acyl-CoA dehydrogenase
MRHAFSEMQKAFDGIFPNFTVPLFGWFFKGPMSWWSSLNVLGHLPSDKLGHTIVQLMTADSEQRRRLTDGIFVPENPEEAFGRLEHAFKIIKRSEETESKMRKAVRDKTLPKLKGMKLIEEALAKGVITQDEKLNLQKAEEVRWNAIQVDDFSEQEYHSKGDAERSSQLQQAYGK